MSGDEGARLECVVLVGLQGSGKTTFYEQRYAATHRHVSKDAFRHARDRAARQAALIEEALAAGSSIVVDNTNPTPADRAPIVALARAHGAVPIGVFIDASFGDCIRRNNLREGWRKVPVAAIGATRKRLVPPSREEGFERILRVRAGDERGRPPGTGPVFEVTEE